MQAAVELNQEAEEIQVIGILTLADLSNANYGAFMQAWALKQALTKLANEPLPSNQDLSYEEINYNTNIINMQNGGGY